MQDLWFHFAVKPRWDHVLEGLVASLERGANALKVLLSRQ